MVVNIQLTGHCNLNCSYCFADLMKTSKSFTVNRLQRLVGYLEREGVEEVRLTGGEPTTHEDFVEVLKLFSTSTIDNYMLFSNLTFGRRVLESILSFDKVKNLFILGNLNFDINEFGILDKNISELRWNHVGFLLGYNVTPMTGKEEVDRLERFVKDKDIRCLRYALAVPHYSLDTHGYTKYLEESKVNYNRFIRRMLDIGVVLEPDCHTLPYCYLDEDLKKEIGSDTFRWLDNHHCEITMIDGDYRVVGCYMLSDKFSTSLLNESGGFRSLQEVIEEQEQFNIQQYEKKAFDQCMECVNGLRCKKMCSRFRR